MVVNSYASSIERQTVFGSMFSERVKIIILSPSLDYVIDKLCDCMRVHAAKVQGHFCYSMSHTHTHTTTHTHTHYKTHCIGTSAWLIERDNHICTRSS